MRSTAVLTFFTAALVAASPLDRKALVYDILTDIVTVTVTAGEPEATAAAVAHPEKHSAKHSVPTTLITSSVSSSAVKVDKPAPTIVVHPTNTPAAVPAPVTVSTESVKPASTTVAPVVAPVAPSAPAVAPAAPPAAPPVAPAVAPEVHPTTPHATTSAGPAPAASPTDFISTGLYYHNIRRADHDSSPLAWNATLADWAAITAAKCVFAHDMSEGTANYGQNIDAVGLSDDSASTWNTEGILADAINNGWYVGEQKDFAEWSFYNEAQPAAVDSIPAGQSQKVPDYLHFTQMVWKNTETVGCATHYCGENTVLQGNQFGWFTVCNYGPSGNYENEYANNIAKPSSINPIKVPSPSTQ